MNEWMKGGKKEGSQSINQSINQSIWLIYSLTSIYNVFLLIWKVSSTWINTN